MKTVLITGAANGIGAAIVKRFLQQPDTLVIAIDKDEQSLARLTDSETAGETTRLRLVCADLTQYEAVKKLLMQELANFEELDVLVTSHGIADENSIEDSAIWDRVIDVNLTATQRLLSILGPKMAENARVIIISSILGKVGKPVNTAYCASKHALLGLVKGLALDWARRGITVNAILPSWVDTPMLRKEIKPQADSLGLTCNQVLRRVKKRIPLRKLVQADDVASSAIFLASNDAAMITAQSIVIDGGFGCGA